MSKLDFAGLLALLQTNDVRFLVVGGVACALNGFVRATEDIDVLVDASPENVRALLRTLRHWGEGYAEELSEADFTLEPGAIRLVEDFPLDMFTVLAGRTYADYADSARTSPEGIPFLGVEELIQTKTGTHREKDQIDILALCRLLREREEGSA